MIYFLIHSNLHLQIDAMIIIAVEPLELGPSQQSNQQHSYIIENNSLINSDVNINDIALLSADNFGKLTL